MTKKTMSILNYDFRNKEERELFREQENALLAERKKDIISGLTREGLLESGVAYFNADERARDLNHGSVHHHASGSVSAIFVARSVGWAAQWLAA